jgi:uncharacterized membrane protein YqjE
LAVADAPHVMSDPSQGSGLFASLRQLLDTVLEIAQVRLELFSSEIEEEKIRLVDGLLWAGLSLMLLGIGMVLLCGFIVLLFWEGYRMAALGVLTLLFLGGGGVLLLRARDHLRIRGGVFSTSAAELARDRAGLAPRE